MNLVLVESPTKARKLKEYLGSSYTIEASMGHVRDLPKSKLGVDVDHDFEPQYLAIATRKAVVAKLKKLSTSADKIYLATDPDREGEAIAWHLQFMLQKTGKKHDDRFVRSTFHEITKSAVKDAIEHPAVLNMNLVDAQQARRVVDRLVGYYLSPVLWQKVRRGLSAGRVQSVALRLIVEREREIEAFKPVEYWDVQVMVSKDATTFPLTVAEVDGKSYEPKVKTDVDGVVANLEKAEYVVRSVEHTERRRVSLPPFTTSTLQQAAANRLGWSSKQTMMIAQQLYEEGFITYHRTDAVTIAESALTVSREYIVASFGKKYLPDAPRLFKKTSKNAQEAHESIRPTDPSARNPNALTDPKHIKLYDLIWRRFIACQMTEAVYAQTSVVVEAKPYGYVLKTAGSVIQFDGWMSLFPNKDESQLPDVKEQDVLKFEKVDALQKFTLPPARYNDASLVKTLEKLGIGRPSTYASIISVISDRGYVERKDRAFVASPVGITVAEFLVKNFPKEMEYAFTAEMEDNLDLIALGEKKWKDVVKTFFTPFTKNVDAVKETAERAKVPVEETGKACPDCKIGSIVIRSGRFGKFLSCSRFPECKHTERYLETVQGMKCPDCLEGDIVMKRTKRGRMFYGCSRYPKCSYASWKKPDLPTNEPSETQDVSSETSSV